MVVMTAAQMRDKTVNIAKTRIKLNKYTQGSRRLYVGVIPKTVIATYPA